MQLLIFLYFERLLIYRVNLIEYIIRLILDSSDGWLFGLKAFHIGNLELLEILLKLAYLHGDESTVFLKTVTLFDNGLQLLLLFCFLAAECLETLQIFC